MGFLCPWDSGNVDRLPPHPAADRRGNPERPAESGPTQTDFQRRSCPGPSQRPRNLHNTHCYFKEGSEGAGGWEEGQGLSAHLQEAQDANKRQTEDGQERQWSPWKHCVAV